MPRKGSAPGGRNRMTGASVSTSPHGGVTYTWRGEKSLAMFQTVLDGAFDTIKQRAITYWRNEEWTKERHPYMTGTERDSGFFIVQQTSQLRVEFRFGAEAPWAMFEEFGTGRREGHYPIRNTLDRVGYRMTDVIRDAAKRVGLGAGQGGGSQMQSPAPHEGGGGHHHGGEAQASSHLAELRARNRAEYEAAPTVGHLGIGVGTRIEVHSQSFGWHPARVSYSDPWADKGPDPEGKSFKAIPFASDAAEELHFTSGQGKTWRFPKAD